MRYFKPSTSAWRQPAGTNSRVADEARPGVDALADGEVIEQTGFMSELVKALGGMPLFLRKSVPTLSGVPKPSLKDFFWMGRAPARSTHFFAEALWQL